MLARNFRKTGKPSKRPADVPYDSVGESGKQQAASGRASGKRIGGKWKRWPELGIRNAGNLAVWRKAIMNMGSLVTSCVIRMQAASLLLCLPLRGRI